MVGPMGPALSAICAPPRRTTCLCPERQPCGSPPLPGPATVLIALTISPFKAVLTIGIIVLIQQAEGHIIVPKVMQKAVGMNPLASIVALLVGAKLFGIPGALLAIPVATSISVVLSELYRYMRPS